MVKYGLLKYATHNIGDEVQSIAAKRFLPRIDKYLNRDDLGRVKSDVPIKLIMNGWFLWEKYAPENWPPSPVINPLILSFHISPSAAHILTSKESIEYLKQHEPIGCRDTYTTSLLQEHGVNAYFSGCLTLTLERRDVARTNEIFLVDVDEEAVTCLPENIKKRAVSINHDSHRSGMKTLYERVPLLRYLAEKTRFQIFMQKRRSMQKKMDEAEELLVKYSRAKMVITSRLHCVLPCLAFGTPVWFVNKNLEDERFSGLLQYMRHYTPEQFCAITSEIDWEQPAANPFNIEPVRQHLIQRCEEFIGKT